MITTTGTRTPFVPNGVTTTFPFDFRVLSATDLVVKHYASDGTEIALPSYAVTGVGDELGGSIVFVSAPPAAAGSAGWIERQTSEVTMGTQFQDFIQEAAAERERRGDQVLALAQEAFQRDRRTLRQHPIEAPGDFTLPAPSVRRGKALLFADTPEAKPFAGTVASSGELNVSAFMEGLLEAADSDAALTMLTATRTEAGAAAVPVLDKLHEMISVKDFGAVGDGVADDTASMQAAIDAAEAGGFAVAFPPGTYKLNGTLTVNADRVCLVGLGPARSCFIHQTADVDAIVFTSATPDTDTIEDIGIVNLTIWSSVVNPQTGIGVKFVRPRRLYCVDLDVRSFAFGVLLEGGAEVFFTNWTIGAAPGWITPPSNSYLFKADKHIGAGETPSEIFVSNFNFKGSLEPYPHFAIWLASGDGLFFSNGHCGFSTQADLQLTNNNALHNIKFSNVYFDGNALNGDGQGVSITETGAATISHAEFASCVFQGHNNSGFACGVPVNGLLISNSVFYFNSDHGVVLSDGDGITITGCQIRGNNRANHTAAGITLESVTQVSILGNIIASEGPFPHAAGIEVKSGVQSLSIIGNTFSGNVTDIQFVAGVTAPIIENNTTSASLGLTAAATLPIPNMGDFFTVSGNTGITSFSGAPWFGRRLTLHFQGTPTVTDGANLRMAGNFVATPNSTLSFIGDGSSWSEVARAIV